MPNFDIRDKFNETKNFTQVKFGENAPLLEVELNEMQRVLAEQSASQIRDTVPSGIVKIISKPSTTTSAPNKIYAGRYVAYINGYRVLLEGFGNNQSNLVQLAEPPTSGTRDDIVFVEAWFEEIKSVDKIKKNGAVDYTDLTNDLVDPRIGSETSRRVQLKWRLRTAEGFDFYDSTRTGLSAGTIFASNKSGELSSLKFSAIGSNDYGLYRAGSGDDASRNTLGTEDGYVYAIPLLRVKRFNSEKYGVNNPHGAPRYFTSTTSEVTAKGSSQLKLNSNADKFSVGDRFYFTTAYGGHYPYYYGYRPYTITSISRSDIIFSPSVSEDIPSGTLIYLHNIRPDNKFCDYVHTNEIIPLYHTVNLKGFNYEKLLKTTVSKFLTGNLDTVSGNVMIKEYVGKYQQFGETRVSKADDGHTGSSYGVAIDKDGFTYFTDHYHRLVKLDPDMEYVKQFGATSTSGTTNARLNTPYAIAVDDVNNFVYVIDSNNHRVIKLDKELNYISQYGVTNSSGYEGNKMDKPLGVAVSPNGKFVYVADNSNYRIIKLKASDMSYVTEFGERGVDGKPKSGKAPIGMGSVYAIDCDNDGNVLYLDYTNGAIYKLSPDLQYQSKVFGTEATQYDDKGFNSPRGLAVDRKNNAIYVADYLNNRIVKLKYRATDYTATWVGQYGLSRGSKKLYRSDNLGWYNPTAIATDSKGRVLVSDTSNYRIVKFIDVADDIWHQPNDLYPTAVLGAQYVDGKRRTFSDRQITEPLSIPISVQQKTVGTKGSAWAVGDKVQLKVPKAILMGAIDGDTIIANILNTSSGNFPSYLTSNTLYLDSVTGVAVDDKVRVYSTAFTRMSKEYTVKEVDTVTKKVVLDSEVGVGSNDLLVESTASSSSPYVNVVTQQTNSNKRQSVTGTFTGIGTDTLEFEITTLPTTIASFDLIINATAVYPGGQGTTFFVDKFLRSEINGKDSRNGVYGVTGSKSTGNGYLNSPRGVDTDKNGNVFIADKDNHRIIKLDKNMNFISQFGGTNAESGTSGFNNPMKVSVDKTNGFVYVADYGNHRVVKLDNDLNFITQFGGGEDGKSYVNGGSNTTGLNGPYVVAVSNDGQYVFVADYSNNRIVKLKTVDMTYVTHGTSHKPFDLCFDDEGWLYSANYGNNSIRKINPDTFTSVIDISNSTHGVNLVSTYGVAFDPVSKVIAFGNSLHNILLFDKNLNFLGTVGGHKTNASYYDNTSYPRNVEGGFYAPYGVSFGNDGTIFVADSSNHRVLKHDTKRAMVSLYNRNHNEFNTYVPLDPNDVAVLYYETKGINRLDTQIIQTGNQYTLAKMDKLYLTGNGTGGEYGIGGMEIPTNAYNHIYQNVYQHYGTIPAPFQLNPQVVKNATQFNSGLITLPYSDGQLSVGNYTSTYGDEITQLHKVYIEKDYTYTQLVASTTFDISFLGCIFTAVLYQNSSTGELQVVLFGKANYVDKDKPSLDTLSGSTGSFSIPLRVEGIPIEHNHFGY